MRNLTQYPITATEKLVAIDEMIQKAEAALRKPDAPIGGVELAILRAIKNDVEFASNDYNRQIVRDHRLDSSSRNMAAQMSADVAPR